MLLSLVVVVVRSVGYITGRAGPPRRYRLRPLQVASVLGEVELGRAVRRTGRFNGYRHLGVETTSVITTATCNNNNKKSSSR